LLTEATRANLVRKAEYADHVQLLPDGTPLPSWIDISVTELCNRSAGSPKACAFCPRINPEIYPNQKLHMDVRLATKIADELHALEYEAAVIFCGFGEPLLHPHLEEIVRPFKGLRVEVVTNGDRLTSERICKLFCSGVSYMAVSMYDGPHQIEHFDDMFIDAGCSYNEFILRDRWHGPEADYGLKLTNRAGTIDAGNQQPVGTDTKCFYPSYSMAIDWNGDVLLCVQDWNKRLKFGNLGTSSLVECWVSTALHKRRMQLQKGDRTASPCNSCNAEGTCHGAAHVQAWNADH
jgi:radical SAM protein with 4Fe4S-binding SPASM domain